VDVSIIITCYNYSRFLGRAIRSSIDQTLPRTDYEIIVVNDASTDETRAVMDSFSGYIRAIHLEKNVGHSEARNIGIRAALGQYVINLDADDYLDRNILMVESLFLRYNDLWDAVSCDYYLVGENEEHLSRENGEHVPIACGIMFRKDLLMDIGLYDPSFRAREEEDLRNRFLKKHKVHNIELPLYRYKQHKENLTKNGELMEQHKKKLEKKILG